MGKGKPNIPVDCRAASQHNQEIARIEAPEGRSRRGVKEKP